MKTKHFEKYLGGILILLLCATVELHAQNRGGGFGGFGGFGRGGFGGFGAANSANTSQSQYTANGTVGSATFAIDPDTHNIVVTADADTMAQIQSVLDSLDVPKPQVLIKVVFLEVQHNNSSDIGVEGGWTGPAGNSQVTAGNLFGLSGLTSVVTNFNALNGQTFSTTLSPATAAGAGGLYQILGTDFQATLHAIAQAGKSELLSRPSILARDGQPAEVAVGQEVPLITGVSYTTSGSSTIPILTPTYTKVGIILDVTPFISGNNTVEMILAPQISSVDPTLTQTIAQGVTVPYLDVRSANTVAVTPNGEPVVIGGLMENDKASAESKIPFLGDIPLLGNLFKAKSKSDAKSELLIFVTPHIVRASDQLLALSNTEMNQSGAITNSIDERELDLFLDRLPVKKSR